MFSANEDLDDISTGVLPLLSAEYYLGSLLLKLPYTSPQVSGQETSRDRKSGQVRAKGAILACTALVLQIRMPRVGYGGAADTASLHALSYEVGQRPDKILTLRSPSGC